jgi:uncharacterized protein YndB with AHSA1/START domain
MNKPTFVYVTYIASTPEKVWAALTDPAITARYWFGYRVDARGAPGQVMTTIDPAGKEVHRDPIIESDPPRRLVYAWKSRYEDLPDEPPSRVTFEITPLTGQVRLTVTHDRFEQGSKMFEMISQGWPAVLSSLKTLLECGHGLQSTWDEQGRKRATGTGA